MLGVFSLEVIGVTVQPSSGDAKWKSERPRCEPGAFSVSGGFALACVRDEASAIERREREDRAFGCRRRCGEADVRRTSPREINLSMVDRPMFVSGARLSMVSTRRAADLRKT